jgi:NAD(P)H-hydrate epimerase
MGSIRADPGGFPQRKITEVPFVSADTMREIQRTAIEEFDLDVLQLMENAGRSAARLAMAMLGGKGRGQRIVVLAGGGNNGAAGLCAARNLANWGFLVEPIFGTIEEDMSMPTRRQARILRASGVHEHHDRSTSQETLEDHLARADLVIDSLVGYGLQGPPTGIAAAATEMAVSCGRPILSLDVPTGVNSTTGEVAGLAIRATTTLALDLPKQGVGALPARDYVGMLYLSDLGVPRKVFDRFDLNIRTVFDEGPIVRLKR